MRGPAKPVSTRTISRDVLKTYAYGCFCVRTNQICIIVSTEKSPHPRTSPVTNFVLIVVQVLSWGANCPGGCPGKCPLGGNVLLRRLIFPGTLSQGTTFTTIQATSGTGVQDIDWARVTRSSSRCVSPCPSPPLL